MCAKIFQRHFSILTFICDYPMHYYHIEQLGSKVGEGMCRDSQRVTRPHLVLAVLVLQQSPPNSLSTWSAAKFRPGKLPALRQSRPDTQSIR